MLCDALCDAGGPNRLSETIGNLGLWTRLGIPTKATRLEAHQAVRFFAPRPQNTKNCDAKCDCLWYNLWEIKDR